MTRGIPNPGIPGSRVNPVLPADFLAAAPRVGPTASSWTTGLFLAMAGSQSGSESQSWSQMMQQGGGAFGYAAAAAAYQYGMAMPTGYGYQWPTAQYGCGGCGGSGMPTLPGYGCAGYGCGFPQMGALQQSQAQSGQCGGGSSSSSGGSAKGGSSGLLEELKAKQAVRDEKKRLQEQIDECSERDEGRKVLLQYKLCNLEQSLWMMGDSASDAIGSSCSSTPTLYQRFREPLDGRNDQFGRLSHVLVQYLRSRDGQSALTTQIFAERSIQKEWDELVRSRVVDKRTKMEDVLRARSSLFEVSRDRRDVVTVRLAQEFDDTKPSGTGREVLPSGTPLEPDKILAIEAYLKKAGGSEQVARLEPMFGVRKGQLARHFHLYEDRKKLYASPLTGTARQAALASVSGLDTVLKDLERLLRDLRPMQASIAEAMVYCIDNGVQHAASLARRLAKALEEPEPRSRAALARLYLVSDVLHNANAGVKGAARYRTSFQELLPDACEHLGRQWLQCLARGRPERDRTYAAVRAVLAAWRDWGVFPPLFTRGLEALLFSKLPSASDGSDGSSSESSSDEAPDEAIPGQLQRRLARWRTPTDPARLPFAARLRGLSGSSLPAAECAVRLCHYEQYWCSHGRPDEFDPLDDAVEVVAARQARAAATAAAAAPSRGLQPGSHEDIDGESLSDGDEFLVDEVAAGLSEVSQDLPRDGSEVDEAGTLWQLAKRRRSS